MIDLYEDAQIMHFRDKNKFRISNLGRKSCSLDAAQVTKTKDICADKISLLYNLINFVSNNPLLIYMLYNIV